LSAGWRDLKANPLPSLAYGLLFALAGDLISSPRSTGRTC
jgi:hypothetical protein